MITLKLRYTLQINEQFVYLHTSTSASLFNKTFSPLLKQSLIMLNEVLDFNYLETRQFTPKIYAAFSLVLINC